MKETIEGGDPEKTDLDRDPTRTSGARILEALESQLMPKAPKIATDNSHGTNNSQTKLPTAGRPSLSPKAPP